MLITLDPFYDVEFYNRCKNSLENNKCEYREFICVRPPFNWYLDIKTEPNLLDYTKAERIDKQHMVSVAKPIKTADFWKHYRRGNDTRDNISRFIVNDAFEEASKYVCAPPLRKAADQDALWKALADGEIQTVSTDHCSFTTEQKRLGSEDFRKIPGGMPGAETRGVVLFSEGVAKGRITKEKMCEVLSENPARLYGMYPKKGVLLEGSDADIVILDPNKSKVVSAKTQVSACDYAPLEGMELTGTIDEVYLRGQKIAEDGKVILENQGQYVKRGLPGYFL